MPQDPAASFVLDRVEDELAYGMENLAVPPERMRRRVEEMLDLLGIEPLRGRSVRTLSGGERQRVAIGAALAAGPRVLVLDEPTSQLDPQGAEDVLAALQRLVHDHGMTVLLAEHRLERVVGFVDLAIGVRDGRVDAGDAASVLGRLGSGPPVARMARLAGWERLPLTVREARAAGIRPPGPPPEPVRPAPGEALLIARGLAAGYDGVEVLRGVDLRIHRGEVVAVMGRNGAGKSTLLRCLAGAMEPSRGEVLVPAHAPRPGIDVAMCPQDPESVLFNDTVEAEVRATLDARARREPARAPADPGVVLERLRIRDLAHRHPRDVSAGERQLVATAAIAATDAPLLLLDEPTRGLDPDAKERLAAFLRRPRGARRRRRAGHPRRGARGRRRHPRPDAGRRRADRRRHAGRRAGGLPRVRAADDPGVRTGLAHARAGGGGPGERARVRPSPLRVAALVGANLLGLLAFVVALRPAARSAAPPTEPTPP